MRWPRPDPSGTQRWVWIALRLCPPFYPTWQSLLSRQEYRQPPEKPDPPPRHSFARPAKPQLTPDRLARPSTHWLAEARRFSDHAFHATALTSKANPHWPSQSPGRPPYPGFQRLSTKYDTTALELQDQCRRFLALKAQTPRLAERHLSATPVPHQI